MSLSRCAATAACCLVAATASVRPAGAEVHPKTLFEKTGRAPLVIWGEVIDGEHRFAVIRTLEVLKAAIPERPGATLRIAYKLDSFLRQPWQDKIEFATGERVLLFLRKFTRDDGEKPDGDLFTLMWGAEGTQLLPAEGERAWVEAARALARILAVPDPEQQARMLHAEISSSNPLLSDGAFEGMLKQGLGDPEMIPELTTLFDAAREPTRVLSMRLLRQILADAKAAGRAVPGRLELADLIRGRVTSDPAVEFRVEAVQTLGVLGGDGVKAFLQRVARDDPSQLVRYEAERSLMGWVADP